jgi:hypothetical protein
MYEFWKKFFKLRAREYIDCVCDVRCVCVCVCVCVCKNRAKPRT